MLFNIKSNYTKWDSFKEFIYYKFIQPIKIFQETTTRIIKWLPILIKDRDWDWTFILIIWQFKLKCMRENIDKYGHHVNRKKDCHNIRIAEILLERLQDSDKYIKQEYNEYRLKYPSRLDYIFGDGPYVSPIPSDGEVKEFKSIMDKEKYMWNQDFDYLFKHLKKHIQSFWD